MLSTSEQLADLRQRLEAVRSKVASTTASPLVYAHMGAHVTYGCKVTADGTGMTIALEGEAAGDTDHLNPDVSADPLRPFQFGNIASLKDGAFTSIDLTATVDDAPLTGLGRIDIAYVYVGPNGAGFGVATGTPAEQVKTDFDNDGLSTALYGITGDPSIPIGALPVARIYVEDVFTDSEGVVITQAQIADIRSFLGIFDDAFADIAAQIATLDAISDDIEALALIEAEIVAVADIGGEVVEVASQTIMLTAIYDALADIQSVADYLVDIATVVANIADIQNAEANANAAIAAMEDAEAAAAAAAEIVNLGEVQNFTNPLAKAVRVAMQAGSGEPFKVVSADDVQLNDTGFTVFRRIYLDETYLTAVSIFIGKAGAGNDLWQFDMGATGNKILRMVLPGSADVVRAAATEVLPDSLFGTFVDLVVKGSLAAGAGSISFFANGVKVGASVAVTAVESLTNTGPLYIGGYSAARYREDFVETAILNRELSDAEVLSLSINGPALADIGASQNATTSWTWSNFPSGAGYETFTTSGSDITSAVNSSGLGIASAAYTLTKGKRYRIELSITVNSGTVNISAAPTIDLSDGSQPIAAITSADDGDLSIEFVAKLDSATRIGFYSSGSSDFSVTGFSIKRIGITGHWNAEDCQGDTAQIFDSSGNKNHALLPASGATRIPDVREFEVRWTNTWAGTHEAQYIGGTNQAILNANACITSIVGKVSGASSQNIIVGDGSDGDRFVASVALVDGVQVFTIANATTDGTNRKLVADPDANFTGSIIWTIKGYILEA